MLKLRDVDFNLSKLSLIKPVRTHRQPHLIVHVQSARLRESSVVTVQLLIIANRHVIDTVVRGRLRTLKRGNDVETQ